MSTTDTSDEKVLVVKNLIRRFDEHLALDAVSFTVNRADTLGIVGESGSGKTTLARCILRAIDPDSGTVEFKSNNGWVKLHALLHRQLLPLRREMQMVFQDPYFSLNPRMTVREIVEEPLVIHGVKDRKERLAQVMQILDLVQLERTSLTRYPHAFSGGQRQRIGIARVLILRPSLVVCDETVSALDVSVQVQIINLLEDLQKELHLTYLFVAHDLAVVRHICNNVIVMHQGRVVESGAVEDVFDYPQRNYTKLLLSAIPSPDPDTTLRPLDRSILEDTTPEQVASGYGLVEGPVWHPERGLLFSDVIHGGVYCLNRRNEVSCVIEHRRGIGGMSLTQDEGVVVSGRNIGIKEFDSPETHVLLDRDPENHNVGYNDLTTDSAGRIYAGSLGFSPVFEDDGEIRAGQLHLIDLDGSSRVVADDILLTNGLGFSPNGKVLYHSDSRRQQVMIYPVEDNGDLGEKEVFATLQDGAPDGLAVAEVGSVWVANAGGGGGAVFDTDGNQTQFIEIDVPMCTSVCFGSHDLRTLFIVSGSNGTESDRGGGVYRYQANVAGLPVPVAKVRLGS